MKTSDAKNLLGCCGLYCGLCSKYQSKAPSRCLGCRLGEQHAWCSIWTCCVKKHRFETGAECPSVFSCPVFLRRRVIDWIPAAHNLRQIGALGLANLLREQIKRQALLEGLLRDYNEGRSMNLYCKACASMSIDLVEKAITKANARIATEKINPSDLKSKARILKEILKDLASKANLDLN